MSELIDKIIIFLKSEEFRKNFLLFFSLTSINFASYMLYFDIKSAILIDSLTIATHFINIAISYVLSLTVVNIYIYFAKNQYPDAMWELIKDQEFVKKTIFRFDDKFYTYINSPIFKYIFILIIFCILYLGIKITIKMICVYIIIFLLMRFFRKLITNIAKEKLKNSPKPLTYRQYLAQKALNNDKNNFKEYIIKNISILLMILSVSFAIGRAYYVEQHIKVKVNNSSKVLILWYKTSSGIGLYNREKKVSSFIPWDNISNLIFIPNK